MPLLTLHQYYHTAPPKSKPPEAGRPASREREAHTSSYSPSPARVRPRVFRILECNAFRAAGLRTASNRGAWHSAMPGTGASTDARGDVYDPGIIAVKIVVVVRAGHGPRRHHLHSCRERILQIYGPEQHGGNSD